jgi:Polyketide cyclase / dehydrase and lipid transport
MAVLTRTQAINKPVDEVFGVLADAGSWAEWNPTIRSSRWLDPHRPPGNGARFEWGLRGLGKVVQELGEFKPNAQVRVVTDLKPVKGGHRFRLTATGDATRIDHELEIIPRGIFKLFTPMLVMNGRKNLRDTANAIDSRFKRAV